MIAIAITGLTNFFNIEIQHPFESEQVVMFGLDDFLDGGSAFAGRPKAVYLDPEKETRYPIIVWWTPFTGYQRIVRDCSLGSCLFTHSRTEVNNSLTEGFMFYGSDIAWTDLPLPRNSARFWALLHEESPKNNWLLAYEPVISLFNYTATCSRHSNYPLVSQYLESVEKVSRPVKVPTSEKSKQGLGILVYIHSDCNPPSDRDAYMKELMKYVTVDSYGRCLHNKDLPEHLKDPLTFDTDDLLDIISKYKFSIAFENAICHDYITEKFWRPLVAGSVPVVLGSPTIRNWAPDVNYSLIVAEDFASPRELAEYLLYLDSHDEEYEKYLEFKRTGVTNQQLLDHMAHREWTINDETGRSTNMIDGFECHVCDQLHRRLGKTKRGLPFDAVFANRDHFDCPFPESRSFVDPKDLDEKERDARNDFLFWRYIARCAKYKSDIVAKVVAEGGNQSDLNQTLNNTCGMIHPSEYDPFFHI